MAMANAALPAIKFALNLSPVSVILASPGVVQFNAAKRYCPVHIFAIEMR